ASVADVLILTELACTLRRVTLHVAHPLAVEGWHLVSGNAREEAPPLPPLVDPPRLEGVERVALERRGVGRHAPRREEAPGGRLAVQVGDALSGEAHELPATAARSAGYHRRRPRRVAELPVDRGPHPPLARDDVDDEPVEEEAEVGDGAAQMAADEAVGAVAADDPARADLVPIARG